MNEEAIDGRIKKIIDGPIQWRPEQLNALRDCFAGKNDLDKSLLFSRASSLVSDNLKNEKEINNYDFIFNSAQWLSKIAAHFFQKHRAFLLEDVQRVLLSRGIRMSVAGCGCCDSPTVRFEVDGREVVTERMGEYFTFDMFDGQNEQQEKPEQ